MDQIVAQSLATFDRIDVALPRQPQAARDQSSGLNASLAVGASRKTPESEDMEQV